MLRPSQNDFDAKARKKIRNIVWSTHALLLVFLIYSSNPKQNKTPKRLNVRVQIQQMPTSPPPKLAVQEKKIGKAVTLEKASEKAPVKSKETPKKKESLPSPKKKVTKKPTKIEKPKPALDIPDHLIKELEDSLAKMDAKPKKPYPKKQLLIPSAPQKLSVDKIDDSYLQEEYQMSLIRHLQEKFELPEHGEVKIALTLKKDGSVIKVQVIKAESEKNRAFLEKNLTSQHFPSFPFEDEKITFVLTFCNL